MAEALLHIAVEIGFGIIFSLLDAQTGHLRPHARPVGHEEMGQRNRMLFAAELLIPVKKPPGQLGSAQSLQIHS